MRLDRPRFAGWSAREELVRGGYGLRQGLLMMPARFMQAAAPFVFDLLLTRVGTAALGLTAGLGLASFVTLSLLRTGRPGAKE